MDVSGLYSRLGYLLVPPSRMTLIRILTIHLVDMDCLSESSLQINVGTSLGERGSIK